ncbi:hypothetical protein [Streptomyces sp. NBC_01768]|uniref:hypothetical protein n=1 Tax=Streptomyces sp. NBC_01768 TaxID=2975938 RepID=UPI002DD8CC8D|nr:hypothetical protein [Streptomyces sp. NBC_01768]WSC34042.1 hypothetical protein OG902_46760 [Streptomyces sp. NBC_01768]
MNRAVRHATLAVADAATEGLDMATVVIGGAIGAWAGYTYYPDTWSGDWRLAFTGAVAVIAAVAVNSMAGLFLAPLRRLLNKARAQLARTATRTAPAVPATLGEGLAQVAAATENDAASRAADDAWGIDKGDGFLRTEDRWRGYEDATASFFLAPGVWLQYRTEKNQYDRSEARFTLLTGDGDKPVDITSVEEIRHRLAARAAGLPVSPATADSKDRDEDTGLLAELDDQLKALGA